MPDVSARKFMTIAFTITYCLVIIGSVILTFTKLITIEVFLALLTGFTTMMMYIIKSYFDRDDRPKEKSNGDS